MKDWKHNEIFTNTNGVLGHRCRIRTCFGEFRVAAGNSGRCFE